MKTGYLWAIARDDGAHGGTDPPAVVYTYMPGRGKVWAEKLLGDFTGMRPWIEEMLPKLPRSANTVEAIRYTLNHWKDLVRFLEDGRIELDNNTVELSIRPIRLRRKNALFIGHDLGAENWATFVSLIETCKLGGINP